jgi:hypothetical protein
MMMNKTPTTYPERVRPATLDEEPVRQIRTSMRTPIRVLMEMTIGKMLQKASRMSKSGRVRAVFTDENGERREFEIADIQENKRRAMAGQRHVRSQRDAVIILRAVKSETPQVVDAADNSDFDDEDFPPDVVSVPVEDLAPVKKNKGGRPRKVRD